jgi:hypothetical protein
MIDDDMAPDGQAEYYERLGYQKVAHLDRYYGPGLHAWRMAKTLDGTGQPPTAPSPRE